jgi:uncharacterized linocin/CFP29 family protein
MNHLHRGLAPVSDEAWHAIEEELRQALGVVLTGRRLVDVTGPLGYETCALDEGRTGEPLDVGGRVAAAVRRVRPFVELRRPFEIPWEELEAIDRGASAVDLDPAVDAARSVASVEDTIVFHGFESGGIAGLATASAHKVRVAEGGVTGLPAAVAGAVATLRETGVQGPYALAVSTDGYTRLLEGTEVGFPLSEHVKLALEGGTVFQAAALDGALVLSRRGGDFELVLGEDLSLAYEDRTDTGARFRLEETLQFRVDGPEAVVPVAIAG